MSARRIIPAAEAGLRQIEAFPYLAAMPPTALLPELEDTDESPLADSLTTPEEEARRLASADQVIFEKLQNAEREAQDIARRAYEEGFAVGEKEGREFGEAQFRASLQRLDGSLQELNRAASLVEQASEEELLGLALAMAEYLAAQQLEKSPQAIRPLLESILNVHPFPGGDPERSGQPVLVFLHPRDLQDLGDRFIGYPGLRLVEDGDLSRGSVRLEAADGVLDATLERRRDRLMELMRRFREKESA